MKTLTVGTGRIQTLAFVGDGRQLLVDARDPRREHDFLGGLASYPARKLVWWDWQAAQPVRELRLRDTLYDPTKTPEQWEEQMLGDSDTQPDQPARNVFIDPTAKFGVAVWEWTNKEDGLSVFNLERGRQLEVAVSGDQYPYRVAFDPRKSVFALAGEDGGDGTNGVMVCRYGNKPRSIKRIGGVPLGQDRAEGLAIADRLLAAAAGPEIRLWNWTAKRAPAPPSLDYEQAAEWEARHARPERELEAEAPVTAIIIEPDGPTVIASTDAGLEVWRSEGSSCHEVLPCELVDVEALAAGANGRLLAGGVGGVEWWELRTGQRLARYDWGLGPVTAVTLDATGTLAAAGDASGRVVVWDVDN